MRVQPQQVSPSRSCRRGHEQPPKRPKYRIMLHILILCKKVMKISSCNVNNYFTRRIYSCTCKSPYAFSTLRKLHCVALLCFVVSMFHVHCTHVYTCTSTHINVATLQGESKLGPHIFDKVQCNLWVALLLQVGYNTLTHQLGTTHHV